MTHTSKTGNLLTTEWSAASILALYEPIRTMDLLISMVHLSLFVE